MTKDIWLNLPVKDINKSKEFFAKLGFSFTQYGNSDDSVGILIGEKNVVVMLFSEATFHFFTKNEVADTAKCTEVLFSLSAESRKEVDEMAKKVTAAGGTVFSKPSEHQDWMYGCGFADLDGHRWNVLYMDMNSMPIV
jgi:uncharacterized protein